MCDRLGVVCLQFSLASAFFSFLPIYFLIYKAKYEDFNLFAVNFYLVVSVILKIQCIMEQFLIHLVSQSIYFINHVKEEEGEPLSNKKWGHLISAHFPKSIAKSSSNTREYNINISQFRT